MRSAIVNAKRIVVKVGSSTLCYANGHLNLERIERLVRQLSDLANQGKEVILVSSGATESNPGPHTCYTSPSLLSHITTSEIHVTVILKLVCSTHL